MFKLVADNIFQIKTAIRGSLTDLLKKKTVKRLSASDFYINCGDLQTGNWPLPPLLGLTSATRAIQNHEYCNSGSYRGIANDHRSHRVGLAAIDSQSAYACWILFSVK